MAGILSSVNRQAYASMCSGAGELVSGVKPSSPSWDSARCMIKQKYKKRHQTFLNMPNSTHFCVSADLCALLQHMSTPGAFAPDTIAKVQCFAGMRVQSDQAAQQPDGQVSTSWRYIPLLLSVTSGMYLVMPTVHA